MATQRGGIINGALNSGAPKFSDYGNGFEADYQKAVDAYNEADLNRQQTALMPSIVQTNRDAGRPDNYGAAGYGMTAAQVEKLGVDNAVHDPVTGQILAPGIIGGARKNQGASVAYPLGGNAPSNVSGSGGGNVYQQGGAANYSAAQLGTPTQWNVAENQTVQGQLKGLMDPNSPLIQQARTNALKQANSRGLLNSSIAMTGADEAAYAAALPIATTDAATYNNAAGFNANSANVFAQQNANALNTAGQFNAGAINTLTGQRITADTALGTARIGADASMSNARTAAETAIATNDASNKTQLSTAQLSANTSLANTASNNATQLDTAKIGANASTANAQTAANTQTAISNANNQTQLSQTQMQTESAQKIAQLQQSAQAMFQGASTLSQLSATYQNAITQIGSLNIDGAAKTDLQRNVFASYQQAVKALDAKLGIPDTSNLLTFDPVSPSGPGYYDPNNKYPDTVS